LSRDPLDQRDPEYIRTQARRLGPLLDAWYAPTVEGLEHVRHGPALVVGNHNGGMQAPEMYSLMRAFWDDIGVERAAYGLAHDAVFKVPFAGRWLARVGGVPAHPRNAQALLERGAAVLVYPGGDREAFRRSTERNRVSFYGRYGFIRVALRARAPIVPAVSVGAHHTWYVLTDGHELAVRIPILRALRIDVLPIFVGLPWGIGAGALTPYIPFPTKVRVRLLPPIDLGLPPEAANDRAVVEAAGERIRVLMQAELDRMVAEGGFGVRARFRGA
jgi:1-acyl-sn-glycerol-3-phosphate acyltransferase